MALETSAKRLRLVAGLAATAALASVLHAEPIASKPTAPDDRFGPTVTLLEKMVPTVVAIHTHRDLSTDADSAEAAFAPKIERAEGSGFIVSPDGFIATNKHVVHGAYDVSVSLHDGREFKAAIVWESSVVDVAFVKIDAGAPLQAAPLASEDSLQIGRRVVAVGNPLGLGISASAGIVSAVDRNLDQTPYDSYVQTDAAINNGNSGGPLFDLEGRVVGMNSIHWTVQKGQGSQGLGFAIPGADIGFLIDQLKRTGHIRCGTIGLKGQRLTDYMADALGYPGHEAIIVAAVEPKSTAERIGLSPGDILESFDGKPLDVVPTFNRATCQALGHDADIDVWRHGRRLKLQASVRDERDDTTDLSGKAAIMAPRLADSRDLGMGLAAIDDASRRSYHLAPDTRGFVVTSVADQSEADQADFAVGDVIESLQRQPLDGTEAFDTLFAAQGRQGHRHVILLVKAKGGDRWVTLPVRLSGPR